MIEEAIKIAKRSSTGKYAMGCVIVDQDHWEVISNGWSHVPNIKEWRLYSLHAELHALVRMRRNYVKNPVAYIAAISRKSGNYTLAKPCRDCAIALHSAGIFLVQYTVGGSFGPMPEQASTEDIWLGEVMDERNIDSFKQYNSPQF